MAGKVEMGGSCKRHFFLWIIFTKIIPEYCVTSANLSVCPSVRI